MPLFMRNMKNLAQKGKSLWIRIFWNVCLWLKLSYLKKFPTGWITNCEINILMSFQVLRWIFIAEKKTKRSMNLEQILKSWN